MLISREQSAASQMTQVRLTVIGVAADLHTSASAPRPMSYLPVPQHYGSEVAIVARGGGGQRLTNEIRDAVASIAPTFQSLLRPAWPTRQGL